MFKIRRKFRFEAAHRLVASRNLKSQNVHGHSFVVDVQLAARELNGDGMVIDLEVLRETVENLISSLDHRLILSEKDPLVEAFKGGIDIVLVPYNPTIANMAKDMALAIMSHFAGLQPSFESVQVRLYANEESWSEYGLTEDEFFEYNKTNGKD